MMRFKTLFLSCLLGSVLCGCFNLLTFADCGKIIIYKTVVIKPYYPPPAPYCPPIQPTLPSGWNDVTPENNFGLGNNGTNSNLNTNSNSIINNVTIGDQNNQAKVPQPAPWDSRSGDGNPDLMGDGTGGVGGGVYGTFEEPAQQAVIAWNGKTDTSGEEILILTTNEKAKDGTGGGAMLSILPLPGEPLSVSRANAAIFRNSKALLVKKWDSGFGSGSFGVYMEKKIGSHNIFVWKIDDINNFEKEVQNYVAAKYEGGAAALIKKEALDVVKSYYDRGFRFFAFDITMVGKDIVTKEAIAYHFKSKSVYFPLVISKIGGTGKTRVDMVILTPGDLKRSPYYQIGTKDNDFQGPAQLLGKGTVDLSKEEFSVLDNSIAEFFKSYNTIKARNIQISGQINSFENDFLMDNR